MHFWSTWEKKHYYTRDISEIESEKKQRNVIHELVKTFNRQLTEIEENSKQSIQHVEENVRSMNENICEMLNEVPQLTMSSLETRFCSIEEKLGVFAEPAGSKNSVNNQASLMDAHTPHSNSSRSTVTRMTAENIESHEEFMIEVADEVDDRQKRRKALVIHNIEETDNDAEDNNQVTNILKEIIDDENLIQQQLVNSYRLGRRSLGKKRTLKVHFMSDVFCKNVLQHARKLTYSRKYKNVVLQPDLTPTQRQHLKMLVDEKKQRNSFAVQCNEQPDWIIRRGKLCRRRDL